MWDWHPHVSCRRCIYLPLSALLFIICLVIFPRVKLSRECESSKHSKSACIMLRTLAMNFSRITDRKQSENEDLSPKQEDKCVKDTRKIGAYLLRSA